MDMTTDYLAETVRVLGERGFQVERTEDEAHADGVLLFHRTRWTLTRGPEERLVLEALAYPDGVHRWHLAVERYHGMRFTSFPLDSWKHRPHLVEFKFYTHPETGLGLSVVLTRSETPG